MILSKRLKIVISAFAFALTLALSNKSVPFLGGVAWSLPVIAAIWLTFWALNFEFKLCEYLIFALYPALLGGSSFLILSQILNQAGQGRGWLDLVLLVGFSLISVSIFYMLLSALNILNVATVRTVPLKKAALLILMLIGLILGTSSFYQIAGPLGLLVKWQYRVILFFASAIAQAMPIFWLVQEEHFCLRWRELTVVALLTMELAAVSAFFPATNFVRAIFISSMLFVLIDLLTKKIKREISNKVIWEHIVLGFFLITFLLSGGG